jgi:hypothetical protein
VLELSSIKEKKKESSSNDKERMEGYIFDEDDVPPQSSDSEAN